jgi:hypothetical protein
MGTCEENVEIFFQIVWDELNILVTLEFYHQFSDGLYQVSKQFILHWKFCVLFLKPKRFPIKFHSKRIGIFIFSYSESYILCVWSK